VTEREFQLALIHLCANIDRDGADATPWERFALSPDERCALEQLMASQREGLLLVNQLSHDKQRRLLRDALPTARALAGARLESLIDAFQCNRIAEGSRDLATTMRSFADFAGDVVERDADPSRELELVRLEAICTAVSLGSSSRTDAQLRPQRSTPDMRLSPDVAVIRCAYDVVAALRASSLDLEQPPARPRTFFVFNASRDELRIMAVSTRLADLLAQLVRGCSVGEALAALDDEFAVAAATASIETLLEAGAPFVQSMMAPE
jgi:hypothetical protein